MGYSGYNEIFEDWKKISSGLPYLILNKPPTDRIGAKTQFISSLIESWRSNTEQTQAQSGSEPNKN